jgi:dipeptidyl aminopeptidase/acylaminoacyl peptidase
MATGAEGSRTLQWLDGAGLHPTGLAATPAGVLAMSPHRDAAVVRTLDPQGVDTLRLVRRGGASVDLDRINTALRAVDPPTVVRIPHLGPDGQPLVSWLFLPPERPDGAPPPLLVQAYAGDAHPTAPEPAPPERGMVTDIRVPVGHGYAVLVPALPMPRAVGNPLTAPIPPGAADPMDGLADRILAVVDAAAARPELKGRFDPTRIALWGHSYGGYTVMAAIGQSDRFRAAVAIAGFSDMAAMWATLPVAHRVAPEEGSWSNWNTGNTENGQNRMGAPLWSDSGRYDRNSPLRAADRIHTPLLLIHGDQDGIPLAGSEAMFSALYRQDKDALLVTYWGEGHILASPGNVRDMYARAFTFLDRAFGGAVRESTGARDRSPGSAPASGAPSSRP